MCVKAVDNFLQPSKVALHCYRNQKMCDKAVNTVPSATNLFMNAIRIKECVIKLFIDVFPTSFLFPIGKLKKCVTVLFLKMLSRQYIDSMGIKPKESVITLLMIV